MSPSAMPKPNRLVVAPINHEPDKLCNFGATVSGANLSDLSDEDLQAIKDAVYKYRVIVIKGQQTLEPIKHWEFVTRLDPNAAPVHGHGSVKDFKKTGGFLSKREVIGIPSAPNVRFLGKGHQPPNLYGVKEHEAANGASNGWHLNPVTDEELEAGYTQFQRWHMDAPLYEREPPHFTALRAIRLPKGPDITIRWDDESGMSMKSPPGRTAFFSNCQLYGMLTEEEKVAAENSWVEYAPYPYMWMENCKGNNNGLGVVAQEKEHKMEEMPEWKEEFIKRYPCVWITPTGEKALQVHGMCVRKLFLKKDPNSEVEVIEDRPRIIEILRKWQNRILKPEYILIPPLEEGDITMWDNWSVFHSAVDYPLSYGPRSKFARLNYASRRELIDQAMHQANVGASDMPKGPIPLPVS